MRFIRCSIWATLGVMVLGCARSQSSVLRTAPVRRLEVRTDSAIYTAVQTGSAITITFGITATNHGDQRIYFGGCVVPSPPVLQKKTDRGWIEPYVLSVASCGGEPTSITPGASYTWSFEFMAPVPPSTLPTMLTPVRGTYRLHLTYVYDILDRRGRKSVATPDSLLVSNEFELREE